MFLKTGGGKIKCFDHMPLFLTIITIIISIIIIITIVIIISGSSRVVAAVWYFSKCFPTA